ncbi:ABC transporter family substrate-binding protein [Microbacterium caowuchunii]|uniref:ABC transporter family substrate-binding protein n=1 Tax=Microbacterium caowuchunii TaxID=2614638 RepID=UPI0012491FDB|nr:ABC transporter family substrate-binding protein [Microbacterium caowuchunii]QEV99628.1 ABC transporter family substrate-binding protein [Microbacterium caowuchunii]
MRVQRKIVGLFAGGAVLALALTACAGGGGGGASDGGGEGGEATTIEGADYNPQAREDLQEGGDVTFPISEITPQLNVNHSDGSVDTARIWEWYNPQTILMSPEGEVSANPNYLTDWTTEEVDGKTVVTYTINPEAVWNDGTPMTWKSYEQTWIANRSIDEGYVPNTTDGYSLIESVVQGDDERQAVVTFSQVYPWTDGLFWHILHPAVNTPEIFNEGYLGDPHPEWGAGPFTIDEFDANGGTVSFVPNENWWGDAPLLETVTFRQLDDTAMLNAFRAGEIDYADNLTADNLAQVEDMDGIEIYRSQRTSTNLLEIDATKPQFSELEVREAIFRAINRDQIKDVVWNNLNYTEPDSGSLLLFPFQDGYEDALTEAGWSYDVDAANALLDDAGWVAGDDDVREKDGVRLAGVLPVFGDDPITEARARVVQSQLAEIGLDLEIDIRPSQDFSSDLTTKNWDLVMLGFSSSDPYGVAYMCQLYCSDSGLNLSSTGTAEIDERIATEVAALPTQDEQTAAGIALESEIMAETWGILPLYAGPWIAAATEGLANLTPETYTGLDLFGLQPVENVGWMK